MTEKSSERKRKEKQERIREKWGFKNDVIGGKVIDHNITYTETDVRLRFFKDRCQSLI